MRYIAKMGFPPESGSSIATLAVPPSLSTGVPSAANHCAEAFPSSATHELGRARLSTQVLDRLGIALSITCAAHCVLAPVLVAVAPFLFGAEFEDGTKAVLALIAVVALGAGYLSHRSWRPFPWLALAVTAFAIEHSYANFWWEVAVAVVASGALVVAHVLNTRACRRAVPHGH